MLDDTGGRNFRMIFRRERNEPCVIFELVGSLVVGFALTDRRAAAYDLSGAGLAAYDHVVKMRLVRGAASAVNDVGHRVLHRLERGWIDRDSSFDFGRKRFGDGAVETFDRLDELRPVARSAVGD